LPNALPEKASSLNKKCAVSGARHNYFFL